MYHQLEKPVIGLNYISSCVIGVELYIVTKTVKVMSSKGGDTGYGFHKLMAIFADDD